VVFQLGGLSRELRALHRKN